MAGVLHEDTRDDGIECELPEAFAQLLSAEKLLLSNTVVEGAFFVEGFCGDGSLTLSCVISGVPCICPFDNRYGSQFDLLKNGAILYTLVEAQRLVAAHMGTPCQSNTHSRTPQLRDEKSVRGLPGLLEHQQQLVNLGNALTDWTIAFATHLVCFGCYFSIENPWKSWMWWFPLLVQLYLQRGVICTYVKHQWFSTPFEKWMIMMHNYPTYARIMQYECWVPSPVVKLRGRITFRGEQMFKTKLSQCYPVEMTLAFAELTREALAMRALALEEGRPVPVARHLDDGGLPSLGGMMSVGVSPLDCKRNSFDTFDPPKKVPVFDI